MFDMPTIIADESDTAPAEGKISAQLRLPASNFLQKCDKEA
jgi:hypothetical protein